MIRRSLKRIIKSSLIRSSGIYTISSIINAAIPLILLPILTNELSPEDYGRVAMFQLAVNILYPFIGMNLDGAVARKYYDKVNMDFSSYIGACLLIFLCGIIITVVIILLGNNTAIQLIQLPGKWLKYIIIVAGCQFVTTLMLVIFQVRVKPVHYGFMQIGQTVLNISLTLLLVVKLGKKWEGRLDAQIITGIIFAIVCIIILCNNKLIGFKLKKEYFSYALRFGIPLIPHALGGMLFTGIDRFFLSNLVGLDQTGNYTVAYQLGAIVGLLTVSVNNAFVPWLFENLNKNSLKVKERIVIGTYLYYIGLIILAVIILLVLPIIIHIFVGKSFTDISKYTTLIVFGYVFQGMYYMVTNYIAYVHKTHLLAVLTITIAILKIPITYFSISYFGAFGASLSYCVTFLIFFIATWILSSKVYQMPWISSFKLLSRIVVDQINHRNDEK